MSEEKAIRASAAVFPTPFVRTSVMSRGKGGKQPYRMDGVRLVHPYHREPDGS